MDFPREHSLVVYEHELHAQLIPFQNQANSNPSDYKLINHCNLCVIKQAINN